jgi:hypothetical protein
MSKETAQLLEAFEALPKEEKQVFVREVFRRLPRYDSGLLANEEIAAAGDQLTALLEKQEDLYDLRTFRMRANEPSRPFEEFSHELDSKTALD